MLMLLMPRGGDTRGVDNGVDDDVDDDDDDAKGDDNCDDDDGGEDDLRIGPCVEYPSEMPAKARRMTMLKTTTMMMAGTTAAVVMVEGWWRRVERQCAWMDGAWRYLAV